MAKGSGRRGGKRTSGGARGPPRFSFEPGERRLALPAKVTNVTLKDGPSKAIYVEMLSGAPTHVRSLGQSVSVSCPSGDVSFIFGTKTQKTFTFAVKDDGEKPPVVTVVGTLGSTIGLVWRGSLVYKDQ
jgi:hypothetical protein